MDRTTIRKIGKSLGKRLALLSVCIAAVPLVSLFMLIVPVIGLFCVLTYTDEQIDQALTSDEERKND